ncbi:nuclear export mediator factor NEMF-like [Acanthaster planci]|uniref:Nuclear export mediator factor NEMF-like n=1 Tax=Acanthaster planci TaxID=133434 RepID=A0A8B7YTP7_ACAPL|nr:nuclear export mediator factor NEMF-like [Acanthaster planci]XP_022096668.1 nuclear export mediator factor NEMF-like [Acanthaster planci]XP_022096669.1 nuclear export mediator factor NEMF-like [Acanthaster planci]XP_022096670.1 nuclear export mediator factor NEMF-like [Acanthaster planci]
MKSRYTTIDLRAAISELGVRLMGLRVINIYDINNKTYLIKLQGTDKKEMLLIESGIRINSTDFDWPKSNMPSNFSMKLRKHLKSRRLNQLHQLGMDRVVDMQFGSDEAAYHLIVELYDRGNIILTDSEYTILNLLRTRTDSEDVRFAVRETYPVEAAKKSEALPEPNRLQEILATAKPGDPIRKILNPHFVFGPAVIEHCLLRQGFPSGVRLDKEFSPETDIPRLLLALREAQELMEQSGHPQNKGYVIQKTEKKPTAGEGSEETELLTYTEYHPFLYEQHGSSPYIELDSFNQAVDEFYSKLESQKTDMKVLQQEKDALRKLENVKKDHEKRLEQLSKTQEIDKRKGELIEMNLPLVDQAIKVVRSAIANQIDWTEINNIIHEAQAQQDPVASAIRSLKLDTNHITMMLRDPYEDQQEEDESLEEPAKKQKKKKKDKANYIDIDLGLSAYANARRFYEQKKFAKKKEQRTVDASEKAIKSAEKKTKQALKDVATVASINKTRKTYWFEKFYWFISSENYLVIAGRDQQQNEMVVKKYLSQDDIYVHADLHGASSVIVKNPTGGPVPPVTLQEAGVMAICYSVAWDAKVVTSAWWVHHDQVSKTAPTGEYLTTGSFMIRGKKNYLPPAQLMMGFGFMFKVDDSCVWRHKDERRVRGVEEDDMSLADSSTVDGSFDEEIQLADDSDDSIDNDSRNGKEDSQAGMAIVDMEDDDSDDEDEQRDKRGKVVETHLSSDDDMAYPDTAIQLHHVQGAKLEPERSRGSSVLSAGSHHSSEGDAEMKIYLGDDQPVLISVDRQGSKQTGKQYLSAKQKRQLKKQKRKTSGNLDDGDAEAEGKQEPGMEEVPSEDDPRMPGLDIDEETEMREDTEEQEVDKKKEVAAGQPPQQLKRGQKNKQKKIKQKYKDQDEEERRLKMEILASAGSPKELRGKKAKQARKQQLLEEKHQQMKQKQRQRNQAGKQQGGRHTGETDRQLQEKMQRVTMTDEQDDDSVQPVVFKHAWKPKKGPAHDEDTGGLSDEDQEASLKDEHSQLMKESSSILDSLTGCPHTEDGLLFGLPVCAPYSVMHNYKFKVKLTPGSGKRGKAAKTALNMFQFSKETTSREKDLFKSVKDTDLSRNLPGKVKVSAPNLQKTKSKTKKK